MRKRQFKKYLKKEIKKYIHNRMQNLKLIPESERNLFLLDPIRDIEPLPLPRSKISFEKFTEEIQEKLAKALGVPEKYLKEKR
jgi:membrane peptidoglycan carboxypeptidase